MYSQLGAVDVRSYLLELRFISITGVTAARGCHYTYALGGRSRVAVESCDHLEVETAYRVRRVLTVLNNFLTADGNFD